MAERGRRQKVTIVVIVRQGDEREGIGAVRGEFGSLRGELNQQVGSLREDVHEEGAAIRAEINARIDALRRTMIQLGVPLIALFAGLILAVLLRTG